MKTLFRFHIQSKSDIITNSSSELFVYSDSDKTLEEFKELLDSVYPNWRKEYSNPVFLKDLDEDKLESYVSHVEWLNYYFNQSKFPNFIEDKNSGKLKETKLAKDLGLIEEEAFKNWKSWDPFYYNLKIHRNEEWNIDIEYLKPTSILYKKYKEKYGDTITLWSIDENPNWEGQKLLMTISSRYHIG